MLRCSKCGHKIEIEAKYCPKCGGNLEANDVEQIQPKTSSIENKSAEPLSTVKWGSRKSRTRLVEVIVLVVLVFIAVGIFWGQGLSCSQTPENVQICENIAKDYYNTHQYIANDVFDCDNMAQDVWDMIVAQGINAQIAVGNVNKDISSIGDANHAWVLAEVEPNQWLAIECTGGYVVYDNALYYQGWFFDNPKDLRDFESLYEQYQEQLIVTQAAMDNYNALVYQYNHSNYFTQLALQSGLDQAYQQYLYESQELQRLNDELMATFAD
ncbi:MAG: zinc ribbon domain-containing protein [Dehalococcoidia bacterium]